MKKKRLIFYRGPVRCGRNHPIIEVTIQMTTAMMRDLTQPIVYNFCNAISHTIPAIKAAIRP